MDLATCYILLLTVLLIYYAPGGDIFECAASRAAGRAARKTARSVSSLHDTRMHRSNGAAPGMRTKMSRSRSSARMSRAKAPSLPQSMVTKLVALGKAASPCSSAMPPRVARAWATLPRSEWRCGWSWSAASAPAWLTLPMPKWLRTLSKAEMISGAPSAYPIRQPASPYPLEKVRRRSTRRSSTATCAFASKSTPSSWYASSTSSRQPGGRPSTSCSMRSAGCHVPLGLSGLTM
mmetsp:Transcript_6606/g.21695  ORF Transcript_6606/g.21695 Transcript_6606/m.21695 type:complete len:235 (-) Transcript_6606:536-1240(-)